MSGSGWVITPSWLSGSWRYFLYSSVYYCHLFLIPSASARSIPSLSFIVPIFAWNIPMISLIFLTRSRLSHSNVFLYFFALIIQEGFLNSPCWTLELCIQMDVFSFSPLPLACLLFSVICKASLDNHFAFLHFFFLEIVLITVPCTMSGTSTYSSSGTLSIRSNPWIYLPPPLYNRKAFDLGYT